MKISKKVASEFLAGKCYLGSILEKFLPLYFWTKQNYKILEVKNGDDFGSGFQKEQVGCAPKLNCIAIKANPRVVRE